jgi:hypothetical protein
VDVKNLYIPEKEFSASFTMRRIAGHASSPLPFCELAESKVGVGFARYVFLECGIRVAFIFLILLCVV